MKNKFYWFASLFIITVFLAACSNPLIQDITDDDSAADTSYVDGLLEGLRTDLTGSSNLTRAVSTTYNNLTAVEIDSIIAAAKAGIEVNGQLESTNPAVLLPMMLEGAQNHLSQISSVAGLSYKMNVIETLVESCVRITGETVTTAAGKESLILSISRTAVENIASAGVDTDFIDDAAGGAVTAVVASVESVFSADTVSAVIQGVASASVEALSAAYSNETVTSADIEGAVSVVADSIFAEVQTYTGLSGIVLEELIVGVSDGVNSSLNVLSSDLTVSGLNVTGLAGSLISTAIDTALEMNNNGILKDIIASTISDLGITSGSLTDFAQSITIVAVSAANDYILTNPGSGTDLTTAVTGIVESVAEGIAVTGDTTVDTTALVSAALSDPDLADVNTSSVDTAKAITDGEAVAGNVKPVISLVLDVYSFVVNSAGTDIVTATVTASDADITDVLSYTWDFSGLEPVDSAAVYGTDLVIRVPAYIGDYTITVTVSDGKESVSDTVLFSVTATPGETPAEAAARLVLEGKTALTNGFYTEALNLFGEAKGHDPANVDAVLYWSILNVGSVVVDPVVRDVAAGAGMLGYPQTLDDFLTGTWTESMPVSDFEEQYNMETGYYEDVLISSLYPEISIPAGMDSISYFNIAGQDSSLLTAEEYMHALAFNLQASYPAGFDTPVQAVVNLIKGRLDETISAINGLGLTAADSISFNADMFISGGFDPFTSVWPTDEFGNPIPIVVGEAEILLSIASMQIVNSLLNSVLAVDLSVDLAAFYSALNMNDGAFWGAEYTSTQNSYDWNEAIQSANNWGALPQYPLAGGFLQTSASAPAVLADSKQYMIDALGNLATAIDRIQARSGVVSSFTFSETEMGPDWVNVIEVVDISGILIDKLSLSLTSNVPAIIPMELFKGDSLIDFTVPGNWPTAEDWSAVTVPDDISNADIAVNLAALYDKPLLAIDNLIDLNVNGEPVIYNVNGDGTFTAVTAYDAAALAADRLTGDVRYAVKIKDVTFGGLLSIPAATLENVFLADAPYTIRNAMVQEVSGNVISYYVQLIEPSAVFSALNPVNTTNNLIESDPDYVNATGSFWYSMVPMVGELTDRVYDGNDDFFEAETLTTSLTRSLTFGDSDYYSFDVTNGVYYKVTIDTLEDFSTHLEVFDSYQYHMASGDSWNGGSKVYDYSLIFQSYETGVYTLKVSDNENFYSKDYIISLETVTPAADGNDSALEAVALTVDNTTPESGTLTTVDADYYSMSLTAGNVYAVNFNSTEDFSYMIDLLDSTEYSQAHFESYGNDPYGNNYYMNGFTGSKDMLYFECYNTGTYYLRINDNFVDASTVYNISVNTVILPDDGNGNFTQAVALTSDGTPYSTDITLLDKDYFSFTAVAGTYYYINISSADDFYSRWTIFDSTGSWVNSGSGNAKYDYPMQFYCDISGTYYIEFSEDGDDYTRFYDISITQ